MRRAIVLLALLGACKEKAQSSEQTAATPSDLCPKCKARAGPDHICHAGVWWCPACKRDAGPGHQCGITVFCRPCRLDGAASVNATPPGTHECGRTDVCDTCLRLHPSSFEEHATFHVCGQTRYCAPCWRDVGPGHSCTAGSFFCPGCKTERLKTGHLCHLSHFCAECGTEAANEKGAHEHQITRFCDVCKREVASPHGH
jgi:hypothetical protein